YKQIGNNWYTRKIGSDKWIQAKGAALDAIQGRYGKPGSVQANKPVETNKPSELIDQNKISPPQDNTRNISYKADNLGYLPQSTRVDNTHTILYRDPKLEYKINASVPYNAVPKEEEVLEESGTTTENKS